MLHPQNLIGVVAMKTYNKGGINLYNGDCLEVMDRLIKKRN